MMIYMYMYISIYMHILLVQLYPAPTKTSSHLSHSLLIFNILSLRRYCDV